MAVTAVRSTAAILDILMLFVLCYVRGVSCLVLA